MLDPHRLPDRLVLAAGLACFAALHVPAAFAVEPVIVGGNERGFGPAADLGATGEPPPLVDAAAGGFDWAVAFVFVLIALVAAASVLIRNGAAARRDRRVATS
jgi:hypothetical protein